MRSDPHKHPLNWSPPPRVELFSLTNFQLFINLPGQIIIKIFILIAFLRFGRKFSGAQNRTTRIPTGSRVVEMQQFSRFRCGENARTFYLTRSDIDITSVCRVHFLGGIGWLERTHTDTRGVVWIFPHSCTDEWILDRLHMCALKLELVSTVWRLICKLRLWLSVAWVWMGWRLILRRKCFQFVVLSFVTLFLSSENEMFDDLMNTVDFFRTVWNASFFPP